MRRYFDADYVHQEARVSGDKNLLMVFGYQGFRIYDRNGTITAEYVFEDKEEIYDQQYIRSQDTSYLEVIWKDGTVRQYGMDGAMIQEKRGEAPDQKMKEEFVT